MDYTQHAKQVVDAATDKPSLPTLQPKRPLRLPIRTGDGVITGEELKPEDIWPASTEEQSDPTTRFSMRIGDYVLTGVTDFKSQDIVMPNDIHYLGPLEVGQPLTVSPESESPEASVSKGSRRSASSSGVRRRTRPRPAKS